MNKTDEEMTRKETYIKIRLSSEEKEDIKKYIKKTKRHGNISNLVRYCVFGYMVGDLIEKRSSSQNGVKRESEIDGVIEVLKEMKDFKKSQENQSEQLHMISSYITNSERTFPSESIETMKKDNIEAEVIKIISVKPMTSEQLAEIFEIPEHRILRFLNPMIEKHILGFNDEMEYILVESEDQLKELKFNEVE